MNFRRVCKEWRGIIGDPTFIQAHMVHERREPPSHTIVFFPGSAYGSREYPGNGRGFLFDEHWRLEAELTAGVGDDMVGACNGLLCFLEVGQASLKVVELFTGESISVPLPPAATGLLRWAANSAAYCFGFDATARRCKIVHHDFVDDNAQPPRDGETVDDEELHVYTVGDNIGWRRVHVARAAYGEAYGDPLYVDGSVYWPTRGDDEHEKLVRFDLATKKIAVEAAACVRLKAPASESARFCRLADPAPPCEMTYGRYGEWDAWFPGAGGEGGGLALPAGRVLTDCWDDGGLYLRRMERSLELGPSVLLFQRGKRRPPGGRYSGRPSFVAARGRRQLPIAGAPPREHCTATICHHRLMFTAQCTTSALTLSSSEQSLH